MNVIEIFAKFLCDTTGLDKGLDDAEKKVDSAGSKMGGLLSKAGGGLLALGKAGYTVLDSAATAAGALAKQATDAYGEYQQLAGGIETLFGDPTAIERYTAELEQMNLTEEEFQQRLAEFKDPSATVMENAAKAYQTAGMSANDYMNTVIGMAGALNKATGDTELSAKLADQAIIDMSDNVNKMGTTMEAVQNAYRGFSRGNFTMLDNLSLGFAGTKEGMQELLDSAEAISGVKYDIESYADIVNAIHVVQTEMGITGTTAKEASDTITGSAGAMKAAWDNLVLGIANPDADLGALITAVVASAEKALQNMLPIFSQALNGIGELLNAAIPIISQELPKLVDELLPQILSAAMSLLEGVSAALPSVLKVITDQAPVVIDALKLIIDALLGVLPSLLQAITDIIPTLIQTIVQIILDNAPTLLNTIMSVIAQLLGSMAEILPQLLTSVAMIITELVGVLTDPANLTAILQAGVDFILALVAGIGQALPILLDAIPVIVENLSQFIIDGLPILINGIVTLITGIATKLPTLVRKIAENVPKILKSVVNALTSALPTLIQGVIELFNGLVQAMPEIIKSLIEAIPEIISAVVTTLTSLLPVLIECVTQLIIGLVTILPEEMTMIADLVPQVLEMVINTLMENLPILIDAIIAMNMAMLDHLPEIASAFVALVPAIFNILTKQMTTNLPILVRGVVALTTQIYASLITGVAAIFEKIAGAISEWWTGLKTDVEGGFNLFIEDFVKWLEDLPYNLGKKLAEMINKFVEWKDDALRWIAEDLPKIIDEIVKWFSELPGRVAEWFTNMINDLGFWASDMIDMVQEEVPKIIDEISKFFEELPEKALQWGADMILEFGNGVTSKAGEAIGAVTDFLDGVAENIHFSKPEKGPLADFDSYAPDMMDLFAQGVRENTGVVTDAVQNAFNFKDSIMGGVGMAGGDLIAPTATQPVTVVLEVDGEKFGKAVFNANLAESQRIGVDLGRTEVAYS